MKTVVISGGTDGIGRGLATAFLDRGDTVVVIGRDADKAAKFVPGATFLPADLSLVSENERVVKELTARFPVIDSLVLCARHYRSTRLETADGFEFNFALLYLSRFLLSHGLADSLKQSGQPIVMNVGGPGGDLGELRWDDLAYTRGYTGVSAMFHAGGLANDMLATAFVDKHPDIKYVLFNPGPTASGFSGEYDAMTASHIEMMKRSGKPVAKSIVPILARIDNPPTQPLSAFAEGIPISLAHPNYDRAKAQRLYDVTRNLLADVS